MIDFYAYSAPGTYKPNQCGFIDLNTEEHWQRYKDLGLNVMFLTGENMFDGEDWENSNTKKCFDIAKKIGIKRVILRDARIYESILGGKEDNAVASLYGEGCQFKTQADLDAYVKSCLETYIHEEEFFGISLIDEPTYKNANAYGQLYSSIKRTAAELGKPDILIQTMIERIYLNSFIKSIGKIDYAGIDLYPFKFAMGGDEPCFYTSYFSSLQRYADYAKKYDATFGMVLQSYELVGDWYPLATHRLYSVNEMMLQINAVLGFGCKSIGFYTYTSFPSCEDGGYVAYEGSSLVTKKGRKTIYYNWAKMAIEHANSVEKFIEGFKYDGAQLHYGEKKKDLSNYYSDGGFWADEFEEINKVVLDEHIALLTRLKKDGNTLFMLENVFDDALCKSPYEKMNALIKFNGVKDIEVYHNGNVEKVKLQNGEFRATLISGEAVFIKIIK